MFGGSASWTSSLRNGRRTGFHSCVSGHSTYQLFVSGGIDASAHFRSYAERLLGLGCTFERATAQLAAVDVPPEANIHEVYGLLEAGEQAGVWDFQEGHCGHPV